METMPFIELNDEVLFKLPLDDHELIFVTGAPKSGKTYWTNEFVKRAIALYKKKAILTNKPEAISRKILEELGIAKHFSIVWGGDTGPFKKPDPDPIHKILAQLKVKADEAVLIGDGINDIKAARSAGVKTVALGYGYSDRNLIMGLGPDYFADTPQALLELI